MYSPHIPGINVCNTELDWGSIFSGFSKLKVEADFQVRPSSSPPNPPGHCSHNLGFPGKSPSLTAFPICPYFFYLQLLLSVHNPNRLDVAITSGQGVFKHDHTPIGSVEFPSFVIKGGAITDVRPTTRPCLAPLQPTASKSALSESTDWACLHRLTCSCMV